MTWFWLELISINVNPQDGVKYDNKSIMVVTLMSGAEYAVDMPSMKSCLKTQRLLQSK